MKCEYCNNELVWEGNFQNGRLVCHRCEEVEWQPDNMNETISDSRIRMANGSDIEYAKDLRGTFNVSVGAGGAGYASSHGNDIVVIGGGGGGGKIARGGGGGGVEREHISWDAAVKLLGD